MANACGKKASPLVEDLANQDGENHYNKKVTKATSSIANRRKRMKLPKSNIVTLSLAKCFAVNKGDVRINSSRKCPKERKAEEIVANSSCESTPLKPQHSENGNLRKNKVNSRISKKKSRLGLKKIAAMKKKKISSISKRFIKEFVYFSKRGSANPSNGKTISYQRTLWWLKKAAVIDNRRITKNDVEIHFINKLKSRQELTVLEFIGFLKSLCDDRGAKMSSVVKKLVEYRSSKSSSEQNSTQPRNLRLTEPKSLNPTIDIFKSTRKGKILKEKEVPSTLKGDKSNARQQIPENERCTLNEVSVPISLKNISFEDTTMLAKESFEKSDWDNTKRLDGTFRTTSHNTATSSCSNVSVLRARKCRSSFSLDLPELINCDEIKVQISKSTGNVSGPASDRNTQYGDGNDYHKSNISSVNPKKYELERNESSNRMLTTRVKENGKHCPAEEQLNDEPMNTLLKSNKVDIGEAPLEILQVLREAIQTASENTQPQDIKRVNKGMDKNMSQSKKLLSQQIRLEYVANIIREVLFLCEKDDKRSNEEIHAKCIKPKMERTVSSEEVSEKVFKKELQHSELPDQYEENGKKGQVAHFLKNQIKGTKSHFVNNIKEDQYLEADINKKLQTVSPSYRVTNLNKMVCQNLSVTQIKGTDPDITNKYSCHDKIPNNAMEDLTKAEAELNVAKSDYKKKQNGNEKMYKVDDSRCIRKANCSRSEFSIANKSLKIKENKASNIVRSHRKVIKTFTNLPLRTVQKAFAMSKKIKNKKLKLDKLTVEDKCKKLQTTKSILPTAAKKIKQSLMTDDLTSQRNEMNIKRNTKVLKTKPRQLSSLKSSERLKPDHLVRNKENFKRDIKIAYKVRSPKQRNPFRETGTGNYDKSFKTNDIKNLAVILQENQLALRKPFLGAEKCKANWKFIECMAKIIENSHNVKDSRFNSETLKDNENEGSNKKANKPITRSKTGTDVCNANTDCRNIENVTADLSNLNIVREKHLGFQNSNRDVRIPGEHVMKTTESDCKTKNMKACSDAPQNQVRMKRKDKNSTKFLKKTNKNVRKKSNNNGRAQVTDKNFSTLEVTSKETSELSKMTKYSGCQIKTMQNRNQFRKCQKYHRKVKNIINIETNFKDLRSHALSETNKQDQNMASNTSLHIQSMIQVAFMAEQSAFSESTEENLDGKSKIAAIHDVVKDKMITFNGYEEDFQEIEEMATSQNSSGHEEIIFNACEKDDLEQREGITQIHTKKIGKKTRRKVAKTFTNLPVRKVEKALAKIEKEKRRKLINIESRKNTSQNKSITDNTDKSKANTSASKNVSHSITRIIAKNKSTFTNSIQDSNIPDNQNEIPANQAKSKSANNILNAELSENVKPKNPKKKKINKAGKKRKLKRKHLQDPETLLQSTLAA
ncbi:uncharacterized protein LOC118182448 [Stegodyphus dumicola]|uniref:uncharacterized protein LOC118182448 n=1 Tax=Stegodyphus dumicola TaxID=202533 RepID=UPI0015B2AD69|nr:uncharacterized protein LOC118182448 [Stegodyphus dumicola]XP_035207683.1 uncharacterized protein LOC118182448 [Stegodyphus dumicola]